MKAYRLFLTLVLIFTLSLHVGAHENIEDLGDTEAEVIDTIWLNVRIYKELFPEYGQQPTFQEKIWYAIDRIIEGREKGEEVPIWALDDLISASSLHDQESELLMNNLRKLLNEAIEELEGGILTPPEVDDSEIITRMSTGIQGGMEQISINEIKRKRRVTLLNAMARVGDPSDFPLIERFEAIKEGDFSYLASQARKSITARFPNETLQQKESSHRAGVEDALVPMRSDKATETSQKSAGQSTNNQYWIYLLGFVVLLGVVFVILKNIKR